MLRDATLHCLARAVDVGLLVAAPAGATRYDPLARGAVRRSVRAALRDAAAATHVPAEGDGEIHHLRLAFLQRAGRAQGIDPNDVAQVTGAYVAAASGYPRAGLTFWPLSAFAFVAIVAVAATAIALFFWPTPEDRFRKTAFAKSLDEPLTAYVIAIAKQQTPAGLARLQKTRDEILTSSVKSQIGSDAAQQLGDVLLHAANIANVAPEAVEAETKELDASLSELNLRLAAHKVPACLDAYVVPRQSGAAVWVLGYYAKRQVKVSLDGDATTVFWGSRIDNLNFTSGGGAYKSGEGRSVIISLDDLEGEVLREIFPALGGDGKLSLGGGAFEGGASSVPKAQKRLTELVRGEIAKAGLVGDAMAVDIGELVSRRDVVLAGLRFEGRGGRKLRLSPRWTDELRALRDITANQALKLDDRLASPDYVRAVARVVDVFALLQEEEFVGHLHAYKEKDLESPQELKDAAGSSVLARATLASRLAVLARPRPFVFTELARVATYAMTPGFAAWAMRGAAVLLAELERELEGSGGEWMKGTLDRDGLSDALVRICAHKPEEVTAAAERVYQRLFKRPVPKLTRDLL